MNTNTQQKTVFVVVTKGADRERFEDENTAYAICQFWNAIGRESYVVQTAEPLTVNA